MNAAADIFIAGVGAVSPAGWGLTPFREALAAGEPMPAKELARPGWSSPLRVRQVPAPSPRPAFLAHARLRRTSPIAHYAVAAALEAMGDTIPSDDQRHRRLGIVYCAMSGCVNYSRRFYDEVLKEPPTASPLVFPETVYNSPASHLAALLGTSAINYTLVGDPGTFLQGIALAAEWLTDERVDECLVAGAEEMDWLAADAMRVFSPGTVMSDGAGALYLQREPSAEAVVRLKSVTTPQLFSGSAERARAARLARAESAAGGPSHVLCDSRLGVARADREEQAAWRDWTGPRVSPKAVFGEGLMAGAAWQCVAAVDALRQNHYDGATVSVVGCNQQAIAAEFVR